MLKPTKHHHSGFTLIELLIVIAIIGILAAVLIPNLLSARNKANNSATISYVRQVVTGVESNRDHATGSLPSAALSCADLFKTLPNSVQSCTYVPDPATETYIIRAESITGKCFAYINESIQEDNGC